MGNIETLVRVHRAGEGFPYTGLKPAGADFGPAIPAADKSLEDGRVEPVARLLSKSVNEGLSENFRRAVEKKKFGKGDIEAGLEFVEAYVKYVHYVEGEAEKTDEHSCSSCSK